MNIAVETTKMPTAESLATKDDNLVPAVKALNFERLKFKYTATSEAEMSPEEWDLGELEYRRFLSLKVLYPNQALVPSKLIDKIWHAHILDT